MLDHFLAYGRQVIEDDDIAAVVDVLRGDFLTTGPAVQVFEKAFSDITNSKESAVFGNATQALHLALVALGAGEKFNAVIVPTLTFLATANAVRYAGCHVVFADVDADTGLLTPEAFEAALGKARSEGLNVGAVMPVHLGGQTVDQAAIRAIADREGLKVLTDACHALGSTYKGSVVGSCAYEDMAVFSFHPVKTIAMGEGGAITTNNKEYADAVRSLRSHGMVHRPQSPSNPAMGLDENGQPNPWYYEMPELGYNYRESDIHCALGSSQLKKLERFITRRRELAALYDRLLESLAPVILPPKRVADCNPGWHLYAARIDFNALGLSRAAMMNALRAQNVGTQVHYIPVHQQPYYQNLYGNMNLPGADAYYEKTLSLPLFPSLRDQDVQGIVDAIQSIVNGKI